MAQVVHVFCSIQPSRQSRPAKTFCLNVVLVLNKKRITPALIMNGFVSLMLSKVAGLTPCKAHSEDSAQSP